MFLERLVSRLRAAHALSFAMAAGQKPDQADLEAAGLGSVASDVFDAGVARGRLRREHPVATASDAPLEPARWNRGPATEAA